MGFFEHLEELRMTIVKSIMVAMVGIGIVSVYFVELFFFLRRPLLLAVGPDRAKEILVSPLKPTGTATMVMSVSVFGGVVLVLPIIAYFVVRFVAPGLTKREKGLLRPALMAAVALFFAGVEICFLYMLPAAMKFFVWLDGLLEIQSRWPLDEYYSLVVWACLAMGLAFEFPLILVILQVLDIVSPETLRTSRRYAIVVMAVIGMLIAPSPDPISMLVTMAPMLLLYEAAIIVGVVLRRRKQAAEDLLESQNTG